MSDLRPVYVKCVDPTDMSQFGIRVKTENRAPTFVVDDSGRVWKSACWVVLYDDGRIVVWADSHLSTGELRVVYGLAERTFSGGARMCRHERWERMRKTTKRRQGFFRTHYYVVADDNPATRVMADAALRHPPEHQVIADQGRAIVREIEREDAA